ncbi:hypothetical protein CXQ85_003371 [Candidozyma haemuli]|uniref:Ariadne domain-containing protein n=1 Tax=Candidozyma haemuli TaxID=45357 RepID=A0A2V1AP17_9ASCO|nr:hypothetical protein CXQ85_003371 [[Candida] haemuloni]PVH19525.1 hypothetical protein CXQ85_003371 [[Candida] haemuloni]
MPHSDIDSAESDISFDYEDDDNSVISVDGDLASPTPVDDYTENEASLPTSWQKPSSNHLSSCHYRPLKLGWYIMDQMITPAKKLLETLIVGHSLDELLVMLHYKKWSVDELTSDFYDDQSRLRAKCGLPPTTNETYPIIHRDEDFMCFICCESGPMDTFRLSCGHEFCAPCYGQYLSGCVNKGDLIKCMDPQCNMTLYHADVDKLLDCIPPEEQVTMDANIPSDSDSDSSEEEQSPAQEFKNYEVSVVDEYDLNFDHMEFKEDRWPSENEDPLLRNRLLQTAAKVNLDATRKRYKWCPAIDCEHFVELSKDTRPYGFDHKANEVLKHTPVEINSGKNEKQNALARYLHYYKRFSVHQHSMKGDEKTLASIHRYMLLYMKSQTQTSKKDVSWNDAQFMSDAIRSLIGGRRTLMWTYAFMFYLDKSNYCDILEGMQDYLNETVEALSRIFEDVGAEKKKKSEENIMQALTNKRVKIVHLSSLVSKRQRLLVECANHGIEEGSLIFKEIT